MIYCKRVLATRASHPPHILPTTEVDKLLAGTSVQLVNSAAARVVATWRSLDSAFLVLPVLRDFHYTMLLFDRRQKIVKVYYYDSRVNPAMEAPGHIAALVEQVCDAADVPVEMRTIHPGFSERKQWNSMDCGVWVLLAMRFHILAEEDEEVDEHSENSVLKRFKEGDHITQARIQLLAELLTGNLMLLFDYIPGPGSDEEDSDMDSLGQQSTSVGSGSSKIRPTTAPAAAAPGRRGSQRLSQTKLTDFSKKASVPVAAAAATGAAAAPRSATRLAVAPPTPEQDFSFPVHDGGTTPWDQRYPLLVRVRFACFQTGLFLSNRLMYRRSYETQFFRSWVTTPSGQPG